jgi:Lrp/AsnC family transcriptional regulator for asnA, asnC and gidA
MKYDLIDKKILEILDHDGRTKFTTIAKTINKTEGTVRNRVKRLQEKGIIQGFRVVTDPMYLGYQAQAIIKFRLDSSYDAIIQMEELPELSRRTNAKLLTLYRANGDHSFLTEIISETRHNLDLFVAKLKELDGIHDIEVLFKEEKIYEIVT